MYIMLESILYMGDAERYCSARQYEIYVLRLALALAPSRAYRSKTLTLSLQNHFFYVLQTLVPCIAGFRRHPYDVYIYMYSTIYILYIYDMYIYNIIHILSLRV